MIFYRLRAERLASHPIQPLPVHVEGIVGVVAHTHEFWPGIGILELGLRLPRVRGSLHLGLRVDTGGLWRGFLIQVLIRDNDVALQRAEIQANQAVWTG